MPGAVKTKEQFLGPSGEKISVTPSQEQQDAQAMGALPPTPAQAQAGAVPPPAAPSPLGAESPIEQYNQTGGFQTGQNAHIRDITFKKMSGMSREQQLAYEQQAVRDFTSFGSYEGMDDPNAPPPPVNVGGYSYNPESNHWVEPQDKPSVMARYSG
jgi:hypothetical protein